MKRIVSVCLCCLLLLSFMACTAENHTDEPLIDYHVTRRYIEHDTGDINLTTYEYDDAWVLQSMQTDLNGKFASGVEYVYNEDSTVVTVKTTSAIYDPTTSEIHQVFDESGTLLRATSYSDGELVGASEYTYDAEGREIKVVTTDSDGDLVTTILREYDENGNLLSYTMEMVAYTRNQEHSYDEQNRITETKSFQNGELTNRIEYTWEDNARYGTVYDADEQKQGTTAAVFDDADNVLVEENYDQHGTLQYRNCYEYTGTDGSVSSGLPENLE